MARVTDLAGKVCVVTGATSGVGRETARGLAEMGATVVLAVRDVEKGERVRREMSASERVHVLRVDVADLDSVRAFADSFLARFDRLDVLVNNAGIHTARRHESPQGFEMTFATNHLGHFLLTLLLLERLKASAPSRVVNVASEAHRYGAIAFDDLQRERRWSGLLAYTQSKLANVMFTAALARRLEGTRVTANAVHPGSVRSRWARGEDSGFFRLVVAAVSPFLISPQAGARTPLYAATSPDVEGVSGAYFVRERLASPSERAQDRDAQEKLWRASASLVGLAKEPPG